MYWLIYVLAAATAAIISLVAIWAARSRTHWFWRAAAPLTCFLLFVPIGAAELNLLFAPVALILFLATAGRDWWQRRKQRFESAAEQNATAGVNKRIRFGIKDLFLLMLLSAVAAWIIARIVQDGIILDWQKLPVAVALIATVAWLSSTWMDRPRKWQPMWARAFAYMIGLAMIPASVNAFIYFLQWESAMDITIAATCITCATMVIANLWLVHVGRGPQTLLLLAAICGAAFVHAEFLGDWLRADYLLSEHNPTFWVVQRLQYGAVYALLAAFVLGGVSLGRGAALRNQDRWQLRMVAPVCMAALAAVTLPLGWIYWRLLDHGPSVPPASVSAVSTSEIHAILVRMEQVLERASENLPLAAAETRQLSDDLRRAVDAPIGKRDTVFPQDNAESNQRTAESPRILDGATRLLSQANYQLDQDADEGVACTLANLYFARCGQKLAPALDDWVAYRTEMLSHLQLAVVAAQASPACRRDLLEALRALERKRTPLEVLLAREASWSERHDRWRRRLHRIVLGYETRVDRRFSFGTFRETHDEAVVVARLNLAHMAVEQFIEENGQPPAKLVELVPRFLDAVPIDPYGGRPLVYATKSGDYLLYSVGADGEDNGGIDVMDLNYKRMVMLRRDQIAKAKAQAALAAKAVKSPPAAPMP